jgi:hypothetical protein
MSRDIQIKKTVYTKTDFDKVVDRSFKTFVAPTQETEVTVEEFFVLYDELFYDIPVLGETQSHQYLINKSSELVEVRTDTQDIQPLLDEIAVLREQILEYQQQLIEANTPD